MEMSCREEVVRLLQKDGITRTKTGSSVGRRGRIKGFKLIIQNVVFTIFIQTCYSWFLLKKEREIVDITGLDFCFVLFPIFVQLLHITQMLTLIYRHYVKQINSCFIFLNS